MTTMPPKKWKKRDKMLTDLDPIMRDPRPTDIIIPVMGPTGSGKSTFINLLLGEDKVVVGHQLESCTPNLMPIIIEANRWENPGPDATLRRLIIVDTPGFDDTYIDDSEILRRISVWLAASYSDSMKLAGVIFLHEISQMRMLGTTRRNTDVFRNLCGYDILKFVVLGTTKWELVDLEVGRTREQQLSSNYWKDMVDKNAQMLPIRNTTVSAWNAVNAILVRHTKYDEFLQIQKELVDLQKIIPDTDAGRSLRADLLKELERQRQKADKFGSSVGNGNDQERKKQEEQMKKTLRQISALSVNISRRFLTLFGGT